MNRHLKRLFCYCFAAFIALVFFAIPNAAQDDEIVFDTDLVTFEVSVSDKAGVPIRDLKSSDFLVTVDGKERPIEFFSPIVKKTSGRPLSVVFALDVSGSVTKEELVRLRDSMETFVGRLADYNSYFAIMTFGMRVKTVQSFTNKPKRLKKAFQKVLNSDDGLSTHAYDAVDEAIRMIRKKSPKRVNRQIPKRVVIVISDGFPVGDTVSPETVIKRANDSETSVYGVILPSFSRGSLNGKPLLTLFEASGVIDQTGGSSLYATEKNFEPLFKALAEEITSSYAIAIYPRDQERDGKLRSVSIRSKTSDYTVKQNKNGFKVKK